MVGNAGAIHSQRRNDGRSGGTQAAREDPVDLAERPRGLAGLRALGRLARNIARVPVQAAVRQLLEQRLVGHDIQQPQGIGHEFRPTELRVAVARPVDRRGVEVAAEQQRCAGIVLIDHVEKMRHLPAPLGGTRIALQMHRHEGDPPAGKVDLRTDRHTAANSWLATRRPEPAAIGFEADHEGTMKTDGTGYGIAVKPQPVPLVAMGGSLDLVAQAQLDELKAIGEMVPELKNN